MINIAQHHKQYEYLSTPFSDYSGEVYGSLKFFNCSCAATSFEISSSSFAQPETN